MMFARLFDYTRLTMRIKYDTATKYYIKLVIIINIIIYVIIVNRQWPLPLQIMAK